MNNNKLDKKIYKSIKWASGTEILAKIVVPITNMILSRILNPEAFGVLATVIMVTSLADVFTDAGFQKYLIQHEFKNDEELYKSSTVAFWTNLFISIAIWGGIFILSDKISILVGNPGLGNVITVSGFSLILTSFSSIQMAIYKKKFDFKTLFWVRIVGVFIPFIITIPLALFGFGYWSLIFGTILTNVSNALILTIKSRWKPVLFYDLDLLKEMFSFSIWILIESILLWLTTWCTTFIIGKFLSSYYLGIYKNSESIVNSLLNIVVYSTSTVLLTALSKVKSEKYKYNEIFFKFQKTVSIILIPMGFGIFLYRNLVTNIILGPQWKDSSLFIGLWALVNVYTILTGQYLSIVFTSKGRPKLGVLSQFIQMIILVPTLLISVRFGFTTIIIARCFARLSYGIINMVIAKIKLDIKPQNILMNLLPATFASIIMGGGALILQSISTNIIFQIFSIFLCIIFYFSIIYIFPSTRKYIKDILYGIIKKVFKTK